VEQFAPEYSSEGIVNHVAIDYSKFVEDHVQDDDVSLIAIKYVGEGKEMDNSKLNIAISSWNPDDDNSKNAVSDNV
jgi:hypothetical protein